jgi:hypothetical protein
MLKSPLALIFLATAIAIMVFAGRRTPPKVQ